MQYPKFIVHIKNKNTERFEYKSDIKRAILDGKCYNIEFNSGKSYNYGIDKVQYSALKSTRKSVRVYRDGKLLEPVSTALDYDSHYLFAGEDYLSKPIPKGDNIEISDIKKSNEGAKSVLKYFKEIIQLASTSFNSDVPSEEDDQSKSKSNINNEKIAEALSNIDTEESRTVFSSYVDGTAPIITPYTKSLLFPFGCNGSQKIAVERAMSSSMSIIEGPPGTGKTQTILSLIANIIYDNKSVAIVSNNNSAVDNVSEKLTKSGYGSLVATLGNSINRNAFFSKTEPLERFNEKILPMYEVAEIETKISALGSELTECFRKRNRAAQLKSQLAEAECEQRHIISDQPLDSETYNQIDKKFLHKRAMRNPRSLVTRLSKKRLSFASKLVLLLKYGFLDILHIDDYLEILPIYANHKFYEQHIANIKREIEELEKWLNGADEKPKLDSLIELSDKLFGAKLASKYGTMEDNNFSAMNYKWLFKKFVERYPIITSTTSSLHSSIPNGSLVDYLIIDESSQVDIIKASVCFAYARRVVIVGDSCQLSHIPDNKNPAATKDLYRRLNIKPAYNYITMSVLDSLKTLHGKNIPTTLLKEHYRCHPDIIGFCNKRYYNDELVVMTKRNDSDTPPFKIVETNIAGFTKNGKEIYNKRQIEESERYVIDNFADDYTKVGAVSPYSYHAKMLQAQLPMGCEADTIHKYQGREKDYIIFNSVADNINMFIDNPNLINVAVSRAVKGFVVIKPQSMKLPHGTNIGDLIRYICYNYDADTVVQKGLVCSIFDLLYKEYNHERTLYAQKHKDKSGSPAEIIMHNTLAEILQDTQFSSIDFAQEYFLRDLIQDRSTLSEDENNYVKHGSRLDFLLYNKIDRSPILAIEVDGVSFHQDETQRRRDTLKDDILTKLKLPLLRLATNGSNERERIAERLLIAMSNQ